MPVRKVVYRDEIQVELHYLTYNKKLYEELAMSLKKIISPILLLLLVSLSLPAMANTGRIITMSGDVKVNGQLMSKSYRVKAGDQINTGSAGKVNIVMSDKSVLDLQPNTKFKLERFSFNKAAPKKSRSIMNLLSGSFRYISGLVGRSNHANATIRMGTATAGIRGSYATFGFDGSVINVAVGIGEMTLEIPGKTKVTLKDGDAGEANILTGKTTKTPAAVDKIMKAAEALAGPPPDLAAFKGLSEEDKAMALIILVANQEAMGVSDTNLANAVGAITKEFPQSATLVATITQVVSKDEATAKLLLDTVTETEGVTIDDATIQEIKDRRDESSSSAGGGDLTGSASIP